VASDGVLVAIGDSFNGNALYVREGVLTFVHNVAAMTVSHVRAEEPLPAGPHAVEYRFTYDGGGPGKGGTGRLLIDGREVGNGRVERTAFFVGRGLTIGADPGTPVTDDYAGGDEYPYTGKIERVDIVAHTDANEPSRRQVYEAEATIQ
jgi:arylsulfatase